MKKIIPTLILSTAAFSASADSYVGAGLTSIKYSETDIPDFTLGGIYGRLGAEINENISAELRVGTTGTDEQEVLGIPVELSLKNFFGAYVRGAIPINDKLSPYAILGYTRGKLRLESAFGSAETSDSDVSFGLGLDLNINEKTTLNAEYISYIEEDDVGDITGFGLSIVFGL